MSPGLLAQSLILGVLTGGMYALMAAGLTLIFGVMRVINIAHAAMIVMGAYLSLTLFLHLGIDPLLSMLLLIPVFLALGALVQWGIVNRLAERDITLTVLMTFGFAIILEGLQGAIWTSSYQGIKTAYSLESFQLFSLYIPVVRLIAAGVSLFLLAGLYALLTFTKLGRAIRATIQNRTSAQLVGVNVRLVTTISFAIGIAIAGATGPSLGMLFTFYPATHWLWIGKLLAIVVLGGLGSLRGAFVAAMLLGIAEQVTSVTLALNWAPMIFYVFLFGVLVVRPQGLFGVVERQSL